MLAQANIFKLIPDAYQAQLAFDRASEEAAEAAGLDKLLLELVKIRTSQLNGCAYCLRMHTRDALEHGETTDRLAVVAAWWESQYFTEQERAALTIAEQVVGIGSLHTAPAPAVDVTAALDEKQVAAVAAVAVSINTWNRLAILNHTPVAP